MAEADRSQSSTQSEVTIRQPPWFLRKILFWKNRKRPPEKVIRTVISNCCIPGNVPPKHHPQREYKTNRIRTTKYTLLSFVPKNLFEQFHRFANLYFIGIVLLNWVPTINAFGKEIAIFPVVFVLGVTAVKDWFEDYRRYKSDKRVNNLTCRVYNKESDRYVKTAWKEVRVGDFVHLSCNEMIPADLLILRCSDEAGLCYIETANLDGESNLKQREVIKSFLHNDRLFNPLTFNCRIECDPPNHRIYRFNGCLLYPSGERVPVSKENLVLRDCVVKNADFVEGIVLYAGHETKAMLNNRGPRYKRSSLEKLMNQDVVFCIVILILLCFLGALGFSFWLNSYKEDHEKIPFIHFVTTDKYFVPKQAFYIFWTFVIVLQVMIPLSLYCTIEIIKLGQVYFIHEDAKLYDPISNKKLECRALNITEDLGQIQYIFSDKTGTLTENDMVFRRCTIGGIDYSHEPPPSPTPSPIGDSTSGSITSCDNPKLSSKKDHPVLNENLQTELSKMEIQLRLDSSKAEIFHLSQRSQTIQDFFLLMAVCNTVVVAKYPHKDQMNSSGLLNVSTPTTFNRKAFRDGTENVDDRFAHLLSYTPTPNSSAASSPVKRPHTLSLPVTLTVGQSPFPTTTPSPSELRPIYEAESPDEIALVNAAFSYNCRLLRRSPDSVVLSLPGEGLIEFHVLHVLPFDATRKRMSVILAHPFTGEKVLYCKGADSAILPHLATPTTEDKKEMILKTQHHLNSYSRKGLRILCMAKKTLKYGEYESWQQKHHEAECSIDDKDRRLYLSACAIETNLELLGATGIEDRLQDGVPETIFSLRSTGIILWVLTGDKQETAVNIAYSCHLFSTDMEVITLNARSKEAAEATVKFYLDQIDKDLVTVGRDDSRRRFSLSGRRKSTVEMRKRGLVIDGHTLAFILDQKPLDQLFLRLAKHCVSVLCCRSTPLQKASIVKLIKDTLKVKTLAIGDGANDVSMIQAADVGVGISGREGMQAVMASDFSLARFRFLERLLMVHGHWCYERLARIILYFFYKNAMFVFIICWYQWFCGFSSNIMFDDIYLMLFNVFFTSVPPVVMGIFDQNCSEELLLRYPNLYAQGQMSKVHTKYSFWVNMLDAVYQSVVTFFVPYVAYIDSDVGIWEFGTTIFTACVLVQMVHLSVETKSWTKLHVFAIFISIFLYFGFAILYNGWSIMSVNATRQNPYWVILHAMTTGVFWFCILLVPILALLPRVFIRALQGTLCPSDVTTTLMMEKDNVNRSPDTSTMSVTWSSGSSSVEIKNGSRVGNGCRKFSSKCNGATNGQKRDQHMTVTTIS